MKYLCSLILLLILACSRPATLEVETEDEPGTVVTSEPVGGKVDSIALKASFQLVDLGDARNIGEFFDHRLRFYKIDQPKLKINKAPVGELVMYFIDSTLARMRYEVNEEVGSYLLDSLGMSKFKPLDSISKSLLREKKVYDRYTSKLNPQLRNYELIWRDRVSVKRYRVKTYDSLTRYYYYQEMYGYKKKIQELELMYYYLEKGMPVLD